MKVPPDEERPVQLRLAAEEGGDERCRLTGLQIFVGAAVVGQAVLQLV